MAPKMFLMAKIFGTLTLCTVAFICVLSVYILVIKGPVVCMVVSWVRYSMQNIKYKDKKEIKTCLPSLRMQERCIPNPPIVYVGMDEHSLKTSESSKLIHIGM